MLVLALHGLSLFHLYEAACVKHVEFAVQIMSVMLMQAYKSTAAQTANSLILASDVADAQPASSDASCMSIINPVASSSHSAGSSSPHSQSDTAALVGTAGDDLEQDSKAVLKAGGQVALHDESKQKHHEQAKKAQRKAFAAATLKTFHSKLFGHNGARHSAMEVEQLVDQVLRQATSLDNLCQMYEGWTAWI